MDHYFSYHSFAENNWFFQKLFQSNNKTFLKYCVRCNKFLTAEKEKAVHEFLKRYNEGKNVTFEERLLDILRYSGLLIYSIEFKKYNNFYNFYSSEKCVDEFLRNVKYKFKATSKNWFKCSFIIENKQNSIRPDFIFYALKQEILKRVIRNSMSGSSWYFKCFVYLAVKILDGEVEISI